MSTLRINNRFEMNRVKFTVVVVVSLFVGVGVFNACKKEPASQEIQPPNKYMMFTGNGIYPQPTQDITIQT